MHRFSPQRTALSRRAFIRNGTLVLLGTSIASAEVTRQTRPAGIVGLVTDLHHADKPASGSRFYRESRKKLKEADQAFRKAGVDHVVELGDFIDAADSVDQENDWLREIHGIFASLPGHQHYVLGNHCVYTLTKQEFLSVVGQPEPTGSFDAAGFHFVILDACFRSDGEPYGRKNFDWKDPNIPEEQLAWLERDLAGTSLPIIVFVHQRLDLSNHYAVRNAGAVRAILEASGKVRAVFQGHSHKNDHNEIEGIHYITLVAMVEGSGAANSGYSLLKLFPDESIEITGFRRQADYPRS